MLNKVKIIIIFFVIASFFVVLNLTGVSNSVKNFFYSMSFPIQRFFWQMNASFYSENSQLMIENQELLAKIIALEKTQEENKALREALNLGLEKEFKIIFGEVFSKDINRDFLLINKGLRDGVFKDSPVITSQKTLIGKISEVYENFSKIQLSTVKESSFGIKIGEAHGIAKGKENYGIFIDLIPSEADIKVGDLVSTSSVGGIFPSGILVGKISKVDRSDVKPFQTLDVVPAFDIKNVENVFIIIDFLKK